MEPLRPSLHGVSSAGVKLLRDRRAEERGIGIAFSDRVGGVSQTPYDTLNLAALVGDDPACVRANRGRVATGAAFDVSRLALARQVHGSDVIEVGLASTGIVGDADVLVTRAPGVVIGVLTADCVPVIVLGTDGLAVVHAGWRGLVAGAIEAGVAAVGAPVAAWVGPSIHGCCYEVGSDVVDAFRKRNLPIARRDRVDPGRAAVAVLQRCGVDRVAASGHCTSCNRRYFSFRRDGVTGRQGAFAWMSRGDLG